MSSRVLMAFVIAFACRIAYGQFSLAGVVSYDSRTVESDTLQYGWAARIYGSWFFDLGGIALGGMYTTNRTGGDVVDLLGPAIRVKFSQGYFIEAGVGVTSNDQGDSSTGSYWILAMPTWVDGFFGFSLFYNPSERSDRLYGPIFGMVF